MKILHIIDSAGLYGAEIMLLNLCQEQKQAGHQPVICSIREVEERDMPLESEALRRRIDSITFHMQDGPNFLGAWRIAKYARMNKYDIIHSHGYKGNILFGFIPYSIRRIPLVSTLHGWTYVKKLSKLGLYAYLDAISLHRMEAVCVVNEAILNHPWLRRIKARGRIMLIPNGIPLQTEGSALPADDIVLFCKEKFTVVSIGRLSQEKRQRDLIDAFAILARTIDEARLLIIGEGPERSNLERQIGQMDLEDRVMLPGYRDDAWRYLKFCRVFALSSVTEGLPITMLEAMREGIPIVATQVGGIPQALGHGEYGVLVMKQCPEALYQGMKKIYDDAEFAKNVTCKAKKHLMENYSSLKMSERYFELYRQIIAGSSGFSSM